MNLAILMQESLYGLNVNVYFGGAGGCIVVMRT